MALNFILIGICWAVITDVLGFWYEFKEELHKLFGFKLKDFKICCCSTCQTFWTGLIYMICVGAFNLPNLAWLLIISAMVPLFGDAVMCVRDYFTVLIRAINTMFTD